MDIERSVHRGRRDDGFDAQEVRRRWPKLFELATSEGFWKDQSESQIRLGGMTGHNFNPPRGR